MNLVLYAIRDLKNPNYGMPLMFPAPQSMRRELASRMLQDPTSTLASFPSDYEIWAVGEWDTEKGELEVYPDKEFVCTGSDIHALAVELVNNVLRQQHAKKGANYVQA